MKIATAFVETLVEGDDAHPSPDTIARVGERRQMVGCENELGGRVDGDRCLVFSVYLRWLTRDQLLQQAFLHTLHPLHVGRDVCQLAGHVGGPELTAQGIKGDI